MRGDKKVFRCLKFFTLSVHFILPKLEIVMEVSLKLNPEELALARAVAEKNDQKKQEADAFWAGNLLGWVPFHSFSQNRAQFLELEGDVVVYRGERHPLIMDGGIAILAYLVEGKTSYCFWPDGTLWRRKATREMFYFLDDLQVVRYKTTQHRWKWYETKDDHELED